MKHIWVAEHGDRYEGAYAQKFFFDKKHAFAFMKEVWKTSGEWNMIGDERYTIISRNGHYYHSIWKAEIQ